MSLKADRWTFLSLVAGIWLGVFLSGFPSPFTHAAESNRPPASTAAPAPAAGTGEPMTLPAGLLRFQATPARQVLEIYQELSGRTVLQAPVLTTNTMTLRNENAVTRGEALRLLEEEFRRMGVGLYPMGARFAVAVPLDRTNLLARLPSVPVVLAPPAGLTPKATTTPTTGPDVMPPGMLVFRDADVAAVIDVWRELSGRTAIWSSGLTGRVTVKSQTALTRSEATWALEASMILAGASLFHEGDRFTVVVAADRAAQSPFPRFDLERAQARAAARYAPLLDLRLRNADPAELAKTYAETTRRRQLPGDAVSGRRFGSLFHLDSAGPLSQAEAIYALEAAAWTDGCRFELMEPGQFRLVRETEPMTLPDRGGRLVAPRGRTEAVLRAELDRVRREAGPEDPALTELQMELGRLLVGRQSLDEAEALFREALGISKKTWGDDLAKLQPAISALVDVVGRRRPDEAEGMLGAYLKPETEGQGADRILRRSRGELRARLGRWSGAADDLQTALVGSATAAANWATLAPVLIARGDEEAYRAHRNFMLTRFRWSTNVLDAQRVARAALLLPIDGPGLQNATNLARLALTRGSNVTTFAERLSRIVQRAEVNSTNTVTNGATILPALARGPATNLGAGALTNANGGIRNSFSERLAAIAGRLQRTNVWPSQTSYYGGRLAILLTAGLAQYRAGEFAAAIELMERLRQDLGNLSVSLDEVQGLTVEAMARHGNGQRAEARVALEKAQELFGRMLPGAGTKPGTGVLPIDPGPNWEQTLITSLLLREARQLLGPEGSPAVRPVQ